MKVSGGIKENGIVVGNTFDKYGSRNPLVRRIMRGYDDALSHLVTAASPNTIHEIGCGEGYWVLKWNQQGLNARGSDFSEKVIEIAQKNSLEDGFSSDLFSQRSIYDVTSFQDSADLIVCCEVMEHLDAPVDGLIALQRVVGNYVILSVPREPIWCVLNMVRGKYISKLGNTPGHIQHWSRSGFVELVGNYFDVVEVLSPIPWTMLLCKRNDFKQR